MKRLIIFFGTVLVAATPAFALEVAGVPFVATTDVAVMAGSTNAATGFKNPFLMQYQVSGTLAYRFYGPLFAGVSPGLTFINQHSAADTTGSGNNFAGHRFFLNPTVGADVTDQIRVMGDLVLIGNLSLKAKNANNQSSSYASPLGFRLRALHVLPWFDQRFSAGAQFEWMSFSKMNRENTSALELTTKQKYWGAGLVFQASF